MAVKLYFIFDIPNIFKEKLSFFDNKLQTKPQKVIFFSSRQEEDIQKVIFFNIQQEEDI